MALGGEGPVPDLGGLEGNDHVGRRTEHGKVAGDGGGERHLHPVVRGGVGEGGGEHLYNGDVGGNVGEDGDDHDEPVDAGDRGHLVGAATHGDAEEGLGDSGVVEGTDEKELADEEHEEAVVDLGEGGLGLGDELLLLGLDLVSVHVVQLLGGEGVALDVVVGEVGAGIVVLALVGGADHEDGAGADGDDADVVAEGEEYEEEGDDEDLDLGPERPAGVVVLALVRGLLVGSPVCVEGILLGEHLGGLLPGEDYAEVLHDARGSRKELRAVVDEHEGGVDDGGGQNGQNHVGGELEPADIVVGEGDDEDVLGVAGHGEGRSDVGRGGEG